MMFLRRQAFILHPSSISSSRGVRNTANYAWKYYWRRANDGDHMLKWNTMMRPFHHYAGELQNEKNKSQSRCIPHTHYVLSPCTNIRLPLSIYMTPSMIQASQIQFSICGMSTSTTKSTVADFSTVQTPSSTTNTTAAGGTIKKETTTMQTSEGDHHGELESSLPASQRARLLFKKYGMVFVGTYLTLYWAVLLTFFFSLDSGLLDPDVLSQLFKVSKNFACETADIIGPTGMGHSMDEAAAAYANEVTTEISNDKRTLVDIVSGYMQKWEWSKQYADRVAENPHLANLAVAWFMVKFTEPVRLAAAIMVTPKVAKALGRDVDKSSAPAGAGKTSL